MPKRGWVQPDLFCRHWPSCVAAWSRVSSRWGREVMVHPDSWNKRYSKRGAVLSCQSAGFSNFELPAYGLFRRWSHAGVLCDHINSITVWIKSYSSSQILSRQFYMIPSVIRSHLTLKLQASTYFPPSPAELEEVGHLKSHQKLEDINDNKHR